MDLLLVIHLYLSVAVFGLLISTIVSGFVGFSRFWGSEASKFRIYWITLGAIYLQVLSGVVLLFRDYEDREIQVYRYFAMFSATAVFQGGVWLARRDYTSKQHRTMAVSGIVSFLIMSTIILDRIFGFFD